MFTLTHLPSPLVYRDENHFSSLVTVECMSFASTSLLQWAKISANIVHLAYVKSSPLDCAHGSVQ